MSLQFSRNDRDGGLRIAVLKTQTENGATISCWNVRFQESRIDFKAFENTYKKFSLSDRKKARLAFGLRNALDNVGMHKAVHDTPTLQAQRKLLSAMQKPLEILSRMGKQVHDVSEGRTLRFAIGKMERRCLAQDEIENWFAKAEKIQAEVEAALSLIESHIAVARNDRTVDKKNIETFQRKLATDYLPRLCKKILGQDFIIKQGTGGEVKHTEVLRFVLCMATCIDYPLTDTALLKAHTRNKRTTPK